MLFFMNSLTQSAQGICVTNDFVIDPSYAPSPEEFGIPIEERFPALKHYEVQSRYLSQEHLRAYKNEYFFQATFRDETRKAVEWALKELYEAKTKGTISKEWFRDFLISLGKKRRDLAILAKNAPSYQGGRDDSEQFGRIRGKKNSQGNFILYTPLKGIYSNYLKRIKNPESCKNELEVEYPPNFSEIVPINQTPPKKMTVTLSYVGERGPNGGIKTAPVINNSCFLCSGYEDFWDEEDPVFNHLFECFRKIAENTFISEELKDKIANFHHLFATIGPFYRGTAWCGEVITDVLWLFHGYVPTLIEKGKSLDLEALVTPKVADYQEIYPMGIKV